MGPFGFPLPSLSVSGVQCSVARRVRWVLSGYPRHPFRYQAYSAVSRDVLPLVRPLLSRRRRSWLPARRSSLPRLAKPLSAVVRHDARSPLTCLPVASPPGRAPERHLSYELLGVCVCCLPASPPSTMCMLAHRRPCRMNGSSASLGNPVSNASAAFAPPPTVLAPTTR